MTLDDVFSIPAHVVSRQVGGETVILDLESGTYFGLDPVGARIWDLVEEGKSLAKVHDQMLAEYEVSAATLENDLLALVEELAKRNLVVRNT